jgi:hypothetical protein
LLGILTEEEGMPVPPAAHDVVVSLMGGYIQTQLLYVAAHFKGHALGTSPRRHVPVSQISIELFERTSGGSKPNISVRTH